jgi:hypothetical protein
LNDVGGLGVDELASVLHGLHEERHKAVQIAQIGGNTLSTSAMKGDDNTNKKEVRSQVGENTNT